MPGEGKHEPDRFGAMLHALRERAGLTQEELAARAGLTAHAVSALERGTRTRPYPHTVRSLADALELAGTERSDLIASVPGRRSGGTVPPALAAARPGGVPRRRRDLLVPAAPLFGREHDIAEVTRLVRSTGARLITLTGPGGVGKTRLAVAVADELAEDHPDGSVALSLAALAESAEVLPTIGRALDTAGGEGSEDIQALAERLAGQRVLLLLDNLEHLLSAAPDVARLVASCPSLTVLVTSRAALRVRGEQEHVVDPLALPDPDAASADELAAAPAGAFVLHRVGEVSWSPDLRPADVRALNELCRRSAGIPLALELATAHLRTLSPRQLVERLDQIPATAPRDLPPRQQSMRATLDWSYQLLTPDERLLFRLLGVFRGGATLSALESLVSVSGVLAPAAVLGLLEGLVEHSLVTVRRDQAQAFRYDLLEPVAQHARSLLVGEEADEAARAHARVFRDLAEQALAGYAEPEQLLWLDRIEADEANILVAIDRSQDGGDGETAGRTTWAMWLYWWLRGRPSVGRRCATRCLDAPLPPLVRGRVHLVAATTCYAGGDMVASADHWEQAYRLGMELDDPEVAGAARAGTGLAALGSGRLDVAEALLLEALPLTRRAHDLWMTSLVHVWLGTIHLARGEPENATAEFGQGLALARQQGDRLATSVALYNLAHAALRAGAQAQARAHLCEGIELSRQTHDLANLAYFLDALAAVESADEQHDRVPVLLGAALAARQTMQHKVYRYYLPDEALRQQAEGRARTVLGTDAYDEALERGRLLDLDGSVALALEGPG